MAAENPTVGVQLIDHDVAEVLKQPHPPRVVWQYARVQHVGVGNNDVACLANVAPRVCRRIAVIGIGLQVDLERLTRDCISAS